MSAASKKTIINILPHPPAYDYFKDKELPGKNWRNKKNQVVGITGDEFPHSLGNAVLKLTDMFNYEIWQPDLRADKVISHTFENNLTYRLFPAVNKKKIYGIKIINDIYSECMFKEIEKRAENEDILVHLNGSLLEFNKNMLEILEKNNNATIILSFHGVINLPATQFFTPTKNLPSKINHLLEHFWIKQHIGKIKYITYCNDKNLSYLKRIYKGKIEKVTMGCDLSFFTKLDKNKCRHDLKLPYDRFIMLTVANFTSTKQIDKFIKVLIAIAHKYDFLYIIIGQGTKEYEEYLKKIAASLLREDKIRFIGYLRSQSLLSYLNSADLFVSTSISEGGPVTVMEAFACEVPIFSTNTGHTAEVMEKYSVGCLMKTKNYREWQIKLENILRTKQLPKVLDRNIAKNYYDWPNVAERFIKIYRYENKN